MTDTFFDLQRFAPVLVGGTSSFTWQDGETFGGASAANLGTSSNPAYYVATGGLSTAAGTGTEIYLNGQDKTPFSIGKDWTIALGSDNVLQVTNGGTSLALGTQTGMDAAVLTINGEYNEAMNGTEIYFNTAAATNVSYGPLGYTVADGASDFLVGLNEKAGSVYLGNNNSNVSIAAGTDTASASAIGGFSFEKGASAFNSNGNIEFWTNSNKITLPSSDVLDLKVTYSLLTGPAVITADAVTGATGGATLTTSTGLSGVTVNGTEWNAITGSLSSIAFDSVGAATVNNSGAVTVDGAKGAKVTIANLDTVGAEVNGLKVSADPTESTPETITVGFTLDTAEIAGVTVGGISAIDVSKALGKDVLIDGGSDGDFDVVAGSAKYNVTATIADTDYILFNATASQIELFPSLVGSNYAVTGGDAKFTFEAIENFATGKSANSTLNGAVISYTLGSTFNVGDQVNVYAKEEDAGISTINHARAGDKVSVASDADGFTVNFDSVSGSGIFEVNGASINAAGITGQSATFEFGADSGNVTVKGLNTTDEVSVAGGTTGITYHFTDSDSSNAVKVAAGETMFVTLDSAGKVEDYIDETNKKKLQADEDKWNAIATIGSPLDTVVANHSDVYNQFYALGSASAGTVSLATFANEDSTTFATVSNPTGIEIRGDKILSEASHISLTAGSSVGSAELNIQQNENSKVVDVTIDLSNAGNAINVAIGTLGEVTASHEVHLSNKGGSAYIGSGATGQNRIFAGTAGSKIRNDGARATITGNSGNDTIWAGANDIVNGGAGADYFYDTASYTVKDYSATDGDAIIATRVDSIDDIKREAIRFGDAGNQVGFGTGNKEITIGDDQNASLNLKVAVMNTNADVVGTPRNVAVAGINGGALDASGLDAAALIVADYDRNGFAGDNVTGTGKNDTIYVGLNDTVNAGAGNDTISIGGPSTGSTGVTVELSAGRDTISGWKFGFDKNAGATELIAGEGYYAEFENDRLKVTDSTGEILIDDTTHDDENHGQYNLLVNDTKWMAIRTDDASKGYESFGSVSSNEELADKYIAEREGRLVFGSGVTENLGEIHLSHFDDPTNYQDITYLELGNNSKADVYGTSGRETVFALGDASVGANKRISLGAGNDVIISSGDSSVTAGHMFYFGASDGLDTIQNFGHYLGIEADPDRQYADTLVVKKYGGITTGTDSNGGARIDFYTEGDNRIAIYESDGISVDKVYQIQIDDEHHFDTKLAKIGNSSGSNVFTYSDTVDYYVGSSAENARDTLNVGNEIANAKVWLDGTNGTSDTDRDEQYYRGIAVVNASAETNTDVALAGNGSNNTLYGGGEGTNNSLWGGAGDNVLIGSETGKDVFCYVRNAGAWLQGVDDTVTGGNDIIRNFEIENGDIVWLGDTTVDDILNTVVNDNSVVVNFNTGGSLTVEGSGDVRFVLNDGSESWSTNKESDTEDKWTKES